ncbi:hypothetical protein [Paraliomyxa miuraensis]|uniref:hypothetical protein n=1 Tax=Paraliomyxa miuraensis TaxID=376150 RepID=UPI00224E98E1|nr:hypothetical protein [Paraliomyxa miuraensis]MCX4239267.1 hypothetical protein [Paraliomyxa miuraensis]
MTGPTGLMSWLMPCLLMTAACTPVERPSPTSETPPDQCSPDDATLPPVVTILQTRDHEVAVYAGDDGLRFTVSLAGGELLGRQLTEAELEQSFPGLHQRFRSAFARDEAWLDASFGAGLDPSIEGSHPTPPMETKPGDPR